MHIVHALVNDLCTQQQQTVDDFGHALLVAGNGICRNDNEVAGAHAHLTVAAGCHTGKGTQGFALAAGGNEHYLLRRILVQLIHADEGALRDVHIAQLLRHGGVVHHAAAAECHLAAILHGQIDDLLHAVDVGSKGGNDDPLVAGTGEQIAHACSHLLLGGGKARALGVGGIAQQGQHAALTVLGQCGQVGDAAGQRSVIDLEVAGLDDGASRAVDGKGHRIRDGVVHMDGLNGKAAQLDLLSGGDLHELGPACQTELLQLVADQAAGQAGAIDGQVKFLQQIRDAADVVFVAVGDEQALNLILVLHHKGEVRDDHIHAVHVAVREHKAAVHDDHVAVALVHGHVLAHFAQTTQRVDVDGHSGLSGLLRAAGPTVIIRAAGGAGALFARLRGGCAGALSSSCCLAACGIIGIFFRLCHSDLQNNYSAGRPRLWEQPRCAWEAP